MRIVRCNVGCETRHALDKSASDCNTAQCNLIQIWSHRAWQFRCSGLEAGSGVSQQVALHMECPGTQRHREPLELHGPVEGHWKFVRFDQSSTWAGRFGPEMGMRQQIRKEEYVKIALWRLAVAIDAQG